MLALALALTALPAAALDLLPVEQAFALSARALDERTLEARFDVAEGYYLYRGKLQFTIEPAAAGPLTAQLPEGNMKHDEFFGETEVYHHGVVATLPLGRAQPGVRVVLTVESQGCAEVGVCFPPQLQKLTIPVPAAGAGPSALVEAGAGKLPWLK
jgi:thiol:disulfide interchange protein DsbD